MLQSALKKKMKPNKANKIKAKRSTEAKGKGRVTE